MSHPVRSERRWASDLAVCGLELSRQVLVDANGGSAPKLGFFASGKRFVVYRTPPAIDPATGLTVPNAGALQIAIER